MHGHFSLQPFDKIVGDDPISRERLNMGIAIVPTFEKILEVLNQPCIMKREEEQIKKAKEEHGSVEMDSDFEQPLTDFTKEDFENALKKASRKLEPEK